MSRNTVICATGGKVVNKPCKWKVCVKKHKFNIKYDNDGVIKRTALGNWTHPSSIYEIVCKKDRIVYKKGKYKNYKSSTAYNYPIQKHHVIPCAVIKLLAKIKHNLKLLGYDINNEVLNGISLPAKPEDIVWHDLQFHKGSHPMYNDRVEIDLKDLEAKCEHFCKTDNQMQLLQEMDKKVAKYRRNIIKWTWPLHSNSLQVRIKEFSKLEFTR